MNIVEGSKSTKMERVAFESGLDSLLSLMLVKEVVTDGHLEISSLMSQYMFKFRFNHYIIFSDISLFVI